MRSFSFSVQARFSSVMGVVSPPGSQNELAFEINTSGAPFTQQRTTGWSWALVMLWKVAMNL